MTEVLTEFYGMTILMDHAPKNERPHIMVLYEQQISKFDIETGKMYEGSLDKLGQENVYDWIHLNFVTLNENWRRIQDGKSIVPMEPIV